MLRLPSEPFSLKQGSDFPYDLTFALACNITSALRTITPWSALVGPEISAIMQKLLPPRIWICNDLAAVTGSQPNFNVAKNCSVLVRESLAAKARSQGECLIIAAALAGRSVNGKKCRAERVFQLEKVPLKREWFRK